MTESQPKAPGWYWARFSPSDPWVWTPVQVVWRYLSEKDRIVLDDHRLWLVSDWRYVDNPGIEWGPRIPEPNELLTAPEEALVTEISDLADAEDFDVARVKLADLEGKLEARIGHTHPRAVHLATFIAMMDDGHRPSDCAETDTVTPLVADERSPTRANHRHLDIPQIRGIMAEWPVMWRVPVPDVGTLTCYSARWCIVHVMDYDGGGWDVYVPPTSSPKISETVAALLRAAQHQNFEIQMRSEP